MAGPALRTNKQFNMEEMLATIPGWHQMASICISNLKLFGYCLLLQMIYFMMQGRENGLSANVQFPVYQQFLEVILQFIQILGSLHKMINSILIKVQFWQFELEIKCWQFHISHNNSGCFRYLCRSMAITSSANKVGRSSRGEDDNRSRWIHFGQGICTNERLAITSSANEVGRSSRGEDDNRSRWIHCGQGICTNERFLGRTRRDGKGLRSVAAHMAVEVPGGGEWCRAGGAD